MLITLIEVVKQTMNSSHYCLLLCFCECDTISGLWLHKKTNAAGDVKIEIKHHNM